MFHKLSSLRVGINMTQHFGQGRRHDSPLYTTHCILHLRYTTGCMYTTHSVSHQDSTLLMVAPQSLDVALWGLDPPRVPGDAVLVVFHVATC